MEIPANDNIKEKMRYIPLLNIALTLLMLIQSGCVDRESGNSELDLTGAEDAVVDTFRIDNHVLNVFAMRVSGSNLVLLNHKRDTIFDALSTPELTYESSGIVKGSGPDEVSMIMQTTLEHGLQPDHLTFLTGIPSEIVTIQVPEFRIVERERHRMPEGWYGEQNMLKVKGDIVLAQHFDGAMEWSIIDGRGNRVATLDLPVPEEIVELAGDDVITGMAIHSSIGLASPDGSRVAVCTTVYPSINIFDSEGRKIRTVTIPYTPQLKKHIMCADSNGKGIYISYRDPSVDDKKEYFVAAIDWDGNMMKSYRVSGVVPAPIAVDPEGQYLYFGGIYDEDVLYRIRL